MYSSRSWPCVRRLTVANWRSRSRQKAEEHRAGVEQAVVVEAVGVHEGPAQEAVLLVAGPARVRHPDVGVHRRARVELRAPPPPLPPSGAPETFSRPIESLLGRAREPVPALDLQPDQPHREVRAAARPRGRLGAGEDQLLAVDGDVLRAVGEAEQAARVGHARAPARGGVVLGEALEAGLRPAPLEPALRAAHDVPHRVVGDHRVVGLDEQSRSPWVRRASRLSPGNEGMRLSAARALPREPEALVEQRRAERDRDRQPAVVAVVEAELAGVRRRQRRVRDRVEPVGLALRELGDRAR